MWESACRTLVPWCQYCSFPLSGAQVHQPPLQQEMELESAPPEGATK